MLAMAMGVPPSLNNRVVHEAHPPEANPPKGEKRTIKGRKRNLESRKKAG